ncbi:MAG: outer membrane lipoprotein carrier protein LolA [Bacteroidales bacterium]|jgi:outer membrane lipoprotein-sorting protein|nr:outer membrane lipoprotein carrier protein LolA [Bacteroidales bacterium]
MKNFILLVFIIFGSVYGRAQEISDADSRIVEKIKQANTQYKTITCDFRQIKHMSIIGEKIKSNGLFYYDKPDQMAMYYEDPAGDLMLIDEDKFVMVAGGKWNETTSKSNAKMRGMKTILSACLQGDVKQMGAEKIVCEETDQYYVVTADIDKKANKSNIVKVIMSFDKNGSILSTFQTIEPDGSYNIYELINQKFNQPINEDVFQPSKKQKQKQK